MVQVRSKTIGWLNFGARLHTPPEVGPLVSGTNTDGEPGGGSSIRDVPPAEELLAAAGRPHRRRD